MSRGRHAISNYATIIFKDTVLIVLGFVSRGIFIRKIGIEYVGVIGIYSTIISAISLVNLGWGKSIVFLMIPAVAKKDVDKVGMLYCYAKRVFLFIVFAMAAIGILVMPFIKYLFKDNETIEGAYLYYLVYLCTVLLSYLCASQKAVFSAYERVRVAEFGALIGAFVTSILQILLMLFYPSFLFYLLIGAVGNIVSCIYINYKFKKDYSFGRYNKYEFNEEEKKKIRRRIKDVFTLNIANKGIEVTDNLLISKYSGLVILGQYGNYSTIFSNIRGISKSAYASMESGIGALNSILGKIELRKLYGRELFGFHCIASVLVSCCFVLIQDFMKLFAGEENVMSMSFVVVVLVDIYINIISYALSCCYNVSDYYTDAKNYQVIGAIVNIIVSIILVLKFGMIGVFLGTLISRVFIIMPGTISLVYGKILGESRCKGFLINGLYFIQFVLMTSIIWWMTRKFVISNYFQWAGKACIVFIMAICLLIILNIRNKQLHFFVNRYFKPIMRRLRNTDRT